MNEYNSDNALTELDVYRKKRIQRDIAVNTRHEYIKPTDSVAANINYFFESKIMEIKSNDRRLYYSGSNIFSEEDIIKKFVTLNDTTIAVTDLETMKAFNVEELLLVETSVIRKNLGTYTLPNITFNASLFKAGISYICILNNVTLKVINSYGELDLTNVTSITLYESGYYLNQVSPTTQRIRVKNNAISIVDNEFILYDAEDNAFNYFPYFFGEQFINSVIVVQNKEDQDIPSQLDFYFTIKGYDDFTVVSSDNLINVSIPEKITILDNSEIDYTELESCISFNPNNDLELPKLVPLYSTEFKLVKITELDNSYAYYYAHRFNPNYLYFYDGLLCTDYRIANVYPGSLIGTEYITTELDANMAIFPLTYQIEKLMCLNPNINSPFSYSFQENQYNPGTYKFFYSDNFDSIPGNIRTFHSHKEYAYRRLLPNDVFDEALLNYEENSLSNHDIYLTEKGIVDYSNHEPESSFYIELFMDNEYMYINLPDNHAVIKNEFHYLKDITEYQIQDLLSRGIFLLPNNYSIVFINGRIINPKNINRIFGNYCMINSNTFNKKINEVKVYIPGRLLLGNVIYSSFFKSIEKLKDTNINNYLSNLYPLKEVDTIFEANNPIIVTASESYKGMYDRLAHFLTSNIITKYLSSPNDVNKQNELRNIMQKTFDKITVGSLGLDTINTDKIVILTGNANSRYNPHK